MSDDKSWNQLPLKFLEKILMEEVEKELKSMKSCTLHVQVKNFNLLIKVEIGDTTLDEAVRIATNTIRQMGGVVLAVTE